MCTGAYWTEYISNGAWENVTFVKEADKGEVVPASEMFPMWEWPVKLVIFFLHSLTHIIACTNFVGNYVYFNRKQKEIKN